MQKSANKGEWSEFYVFLKILSDKKLHSADETLTLIPNSFLKVLSIIRSEDKKELIYEIDADNDRVLVKSGLEILANIPIFRITQKLSKILKNIEKGASSERTFKISDAQDVMEELHCKKIKSSSSKKTDISVKIKECHTGTQPVIGFSIKSKLGSMSTLLNASGATNFEFEIIDSVIEKAQYGKQPKVNLKQILADHKSLKFVCVLNKNFKKNLMMIDSRMPEIVAEMVKAYYLGFHTTVKELTMHVQKNDPLGIKDSQHFYAHNVQELLSSVAFGMQPSKSWNGSYEIHGGYIVVKKGGELACYHVYNRDKFRKFLFVNTKFETPSTTRHKFGKVYECDGRKYIQLNLQIRFKD